MDEIGMLLVAFAVLVSAQLLIEVARPLIRRRFAPHQSLLRRRLMANLRDGTAIEGVLVRQDGPLLIFANATYNEPGAQPARLDGEVVVERDRVAFLQAP